MTQDDKAESEASAVGTFCNYGVILRTRRDRLPFIQRVLAANSGRIFYEDVVATDVLLYIERKPATNYLPRDPRGRDK